MFRFPLRVHLNGVKSAWMALDTAPGATIFAAEPVNAKFYCGTRWKSLNMGLKKAPLLGPSASVGATGQSVIEGDRSLLSHFGASSESQIGALNVAARKSAALRRNLVARGLARQYSDQRAREENFKTQVPRHQRQKKILENYQRHQAQRLAEDEKRAKDPERREGSDEEDDFSENVVLVLTKRMNSTPSKPSSRPVRHMSPIVPPKGATSFLRNSSMRQLRENQDQVQADDGIPTGPGQRIITARLKLSPSEADLPRANLRPVPRPASSSRVHKEKENATPGLTNRPAPWLSVDNRSSRIVLRELAITKDIMMREQLARQLKQTIPMIDTLARDFLTAQDDYKQAQATLEAANAMSPSRIKKTGSLIGLTLTTPAEADQVHVAVAEAEVVVTEANARVVELTKRLSHHVHHVEMLVAGVQQATLSVVEGILDWRQLRQRRRQLSNFQRLFRFPWRGQKTSNYLLYVDGDLRTLFPSVSLELLLGPKATYNPLLLSRKAVKLLGTSSTGQTFLTERQECGASALTGKGPVSPVRSEQCCLNAADKARLKDALASSETFFSSPTKPKTPAINHDRLRQCLEAIYQEKALEELERQRCGEEDERVQNTYDPFSTIKSAGGVEETLSNMIALQSPHSHLLGEQLRIRQEDTKRATPAASGTQTDQPDAANEVLHLNPGRLRLFLEKRAACLESAADCELRDIQRWGQKNKLQGKMLVRKNNEKRVEHHLARKIQLQYLAHRQRNAMAISLTNFVQSIRVSVIHIQRIFRGYRAQCDYKGMRNVWLEHKRRIAAARTITNAFRRYRRRLHHRRSMTVESIAQAQLFNLLSNKSNEPGDDQDAAERYRRVGEERRRQRIVLLQKHKMEQQELERKRAAAAVQMQAVVRAHLAQGQAKILRQEKKAHMNAVSAMAIQSTIRKFLNIQQQRRHRFRRDLERVNQSAVRIQSIYRGYNSRASLLGQLDEHTRQTLARGFTVNTLNEGDSDDDEDDDEESASSDKDLDEDLDEDDRFEKPMAMQGDRLPPIAASNSRPSSSRSNSIALDEKAATRSRTPPIPVSLPPLWTRDGSSSSLLSSASSTGTGRRISIGMTRIELKLKEAELGDKFDTPPSRRNSFVGNLRQQT
ncbi:Endonuclease/Exonuclease/phosphatase [Phytophthora pseudosyringae]|uniref:Endonuclease/Exonuclease/phosphatase n=1 Tax=Phytophthora pseudosyringae TaxID=221518 RepID=A0A8T1WIJ7_9STRA|nr:Endonuclease/Exonuclease/phosphatase [Phytophthora pseudosyringae]